MICLKCGVQNEETTSYCRQCGTNLQAVRSALLGPPPAPPQQQHMQPMLHSKHGPLLLIACGFFGFLSFGALFAAIITIIALGADAGSRLAPNSIIPMVILLSITGTLGIVGVVRMLLKTITAMSVPVGPPSHADAGGRALAAAPQQGALPPPRQPASVVEHTTAHLPNYVPAVRNTGE
jgi:hypothetical protein